MRNSIFTLSLALILFFCTDSRAQLDLEDIMQNEEQAKTAETKPENAEATDAAQITDEAAQQPSQHEKAKATATETKADTAEKTEDEGANKENTAADNKTDAQADSAEAPVAEDQPADETEAETEAAAAEDDAAAEEAEADAEAEIDEQIILPEDEPDIAADTEAEEEAPVILPEDESNEEDVSPNVTDSATSEDSSASAAESDVQLDNDNFMVQYFNDVDAAAAEDAANQAARDAATALIRDEPTMVTIPEEQQRLLKIGEKRRLQREEKRRQEIEEQKRLEAEELAKKEAEAKAKAEAEAAEAEAKRANDPEYIAARAAEAERQKKEQMLSKYEKAPFGLYWGLSKEQTEELGFQFKEATLENYQNVYALLNPKQQQKQFDPIFVIFGNRNHLNTVYAEGIFAKDTPQAEKVLKIYNQYYTALKKKYGNEKEHFKPNKHQEKVDAPAAIKQTAAESEIKAKPKEITVEHQRGNDNFLKELQEEKASLYAVFGNEKVQVTLSVEVNDQSQSRIVLDYENLETQKSDNKDTLSDLINDL